MTPHERLLRIVSDVRELDINAILEHDEALGGALHKGPLSDPVTAALAIRDARKKMAHLEIDLILDSIERPGPDPTGVEACDSPPRAGRVHPDAMTRPNRD